MYLVIVPVALVGGVAVAVMDVVHVVAVGDGDVATVRAVLVVVAFVDVVLLGLALVPVAFMLAVEVAVVDVVGVVAVGDGDVAAVGAVGVGVAFVGGVGHGFSFVE